MNRASDPRLVKWFSVSALAFALLSMGISTSACLGWLLRIEVLKTWIANGPPVHIFTAGCYLLLGIALLALRRPQGADAAWPLRIFAIAASSAVLIIALVSLIAAFSRSGLGFAQPIDHGNLAGQIANAGAVLVSPISAVNLLLLASALLLLDWKGHPGWPAQGLAFISTIVSVFELLDFIANDVSVYTHVSLPGALSSLLVALGAILIRSERALGGLLTRRGAGARWLRRALPATMALLILTGWILSKPMLTTAHFTWLEASILAISAGVAITGVVAGVAVLLERGELQRDRAVAALQLRPEQLHRLLDQYEEAPIELGVRRWSVAGIAIGVMLALAGFFASWHSMHESATDDDWVAHTEQVHAAIEMTLSHVIDLQTGMRGFVATGDKSLLQAFNRGQRAVPDDLDRLAKLTADNATQQANIRQLRWLANAAHVIEVNLISARMRSGNLPAAALLLEDERQTDAARAVLTAMAGEEERLFDLRHREAENARQELEGILLVSMLPGIAMLIFAGIVTSRQIDRSVKLRGQVESMNASLESRVSERTADLRESENKLRIFVEYAPAALAMFDREMRYIVASRHWLADFGLADSDVRGCSHYELFPEIPAHWKEVHRRALAGEVMRDDDEKFERLNGSIQRLRWEARPWYDASGNIGGILLLSEEITARKQAEDGLREQAQLLDLAQVMVRELDGRISFWMSGAEKLYGIRAADAIGRISHELLKTRFPEPLAEIEEKFLKAGTWQGELTHSRPDGSTVIVKSLWVLQRDKQGRPARVLEANADVTALKQAQAALEESEQRVRLLLDSAAEAIIGNDLEGNCTFCNTAGLRVLGYERPEELIGRNLHETVHSISPDGSRLEPEDCPLGEALRSGRAFHSDEMFFVKKDGAPFPVQCWSHPLVLQGEHCGAVVTFFDITERKRSEAVIRENRAQLDTALSSMTDAVFISDCEGRFIEFNEGFAAFHRFKSKDECLKTLEEYPECLEVCFTESQEPVSLEHWAVPRALRGETAVDAEYNLRRRDTGESWVGSYSFAPIRDTAGAILGSVVVARDITQKKADEREIRELNERLEQRVHERTSQLEAANKELETFTYSVSHDLRAPLRHISGFSKILLEDFRAVLPADAKHYLEKIVDGTRRMGLLVDDLLNLGRVGRQEIRLQVAGLRSIVDDVIAECNSEWSGRTVEWKIGSLPFVECDPGLLKLVLQNIISNALKFTRTRSVAVIEIGQKMEGGVPAVYVRDNGVGFSMKYADKLFGIFQRLHRQEDFEGTGVGLATVQRIIRKHGGQIWAEAELDKGAAFYFTLSAPETDAPDPRAILIGEQR
jgi:PAS domain S-box-containing protein